MINLAIALGATVVTLLVFGLILGGGSFNFWYGLLPALIALIATYGLLVRRTLKQVEVIMAQAQAEMLKMQEFAAKAAQRARPGVPPSVYEDQIKGQMRQIIEVLKRAYILKRWQFLIEAQIDAQIGTLHYTIREFDQAETYLARALPKNRLEQFMARNWIAQAMLAVLFFRRRDYDRMKAIFEGALNANGKEAMLWSLYAWCLWKNKDRDAAVKVLARAKPHTKDARLENQLLALQNDQPLDMTIWGDVWYNFHLARPPANQLPQQQPDMPNMGRVSRRGLYR